jgi:peptide/nickel transport system permease protein
MVFSWPGLGRYAVDAIQRLDYNVTMATTLIIAAIFVVMNLLVDVLYLFLDPRISYS